MQINLSTKYFKFILNVYKLKTDSIIKVGLFDDRYSETPNLYVLVKKKDPWIESAKIHKMYKAAYLSSDKNNIVVVLDLGEYAKLVPKLLAGHITNLFTKEEQKAMGISARSTPEIYSKMNKTSVGKKYFLNTLSDKFGFIGADNFIDNVEHWECPSNKETESI